MSASIYRTGSKSKPKPKRKATAETAPPTPATGRRVKRRKVAKPTKSSKPPTAAKSKKTARGRKATSTAKTAKPRGAVKSKKAGKAHKATVSAKTSKPIAVSKKANAMKPQSTAKRRAIPAAIRAKHRVTSTAEKSVVFTLSAPTGVDVSIAGAFNNWTPQTMSKGPDELWHITLQLSPGRYQYRFIVDNVGWQDPNNPRKIANEHGSFNSVCEVL